MVYLGDEGDLALVLGPLSVSLLRGVGALLRDSEREGREEATVVER